MFQKEKNGPASDRLPSAGATLIAAGTVLQGDVRSENDLRIDGTIHGNVTCTAKIIIGTTGLVEGHIQGTHADISGTVKGNITVRELLQLRAQGNIQGNIAAAKLQIDQQSTFNGQCQMGAQPAPVLQMSEADAAIKAK